MAKGLPEYSNEEIMQILQEFKKLSEEEKNKRKLGQGVDKLVYDIPGKDVVLKVPNTERSYTLNSLDSDYIYSKQLNKYIPVETPVLIKDPSDGDFLLQRKLKPLDDQEGPSEEFYKSLYDKQKYPDKNSIDFAIKQERNRIKNLPDNLAETEYYKNFDKAGLQEGDIHRKNIGIDQTGKTKAFDVSKFWLGNHAPDGVDVEKANDSLYKMRNTFSDKMDSLTKPRIFRSVPIIGPAIGAAIAAASGDSNAASALPILGEAEDIGKDSDKQMEDDTPQVKMMAESANDPNVKRMALQELKNRLK